MLARFLGALGSRLGRQGREEPLAHAKRLVGGAQASLAAGDLAEAVAGFERALALAPGLAEALNGRAHLHRLAGEHEDAIALCDQIVEGAPGDIDAWITRAFASRALGRLNDALEGFERAVALEARSGLIACVGGILYQQGEIARALAEMDRAIACDPTADFIHSNRLFILSHHGGLSPADTARAHVEWGRGVEARMASWRLAHTNDRDPERRLKIGYVSADLRTHSVAFYLAPVLENRDRDRIEVHCYDNQAGPGDAFTQRLKALSDHWVRIAALDDQAFAQRVRLDGIDILVDLSGHTAGNRLPAFAMKPAPVQVSWFGYMNTTGLRSIDYRLTDAGLCPPGSEAHYTEALFRLPAVVAWAPAPDCPQSGPSPFLSNQHIRFGSFNNWAKVSDEVVAVWARLLARLPMARLLVLAAGGDSAGGRAAITDRFAQHGIEPARIEIEGVKPLAEFLTLVASVDIALDAFPYNGGTTNVHTLWMNVPVVSLVADREVSNAVRGLMRSTGLADMCVGDPDAYLAAAVSLAGDQGRLTTLRASLRDRLRASPLMDAARMTASVESAYRAMWHNYLEGGRARLEA